MGQFLSHYVTLRIFGPFGEMDLIVLLEWFKTVS